MTASPPPADATASSGLTYFRELQGKQEHRETSAKGRDWSNVRPIILMVVAGSVTFWIWQSSFVGRPLSLPLVTILASTFISIAIFGLLLFPILRPHSARARVTVDGDDVSVRQRGNYLTAGAVSVFFWLLAACFLWAGSGSDFPLPGGAVVNYGFSAFMIVIPLVFVSAAVGGSELTITDDTLEFRAGVMTSATVHLNPYVHTRIVTVKGSQNLTVSVYPAAQIRVFGIRRRSRHMSIPGLAFPQLDLYPLSVLLEERGAKQAPVVLPDDSTPFPEFRPSALMLIICSEVLALGSTVLLGWTAPDIAVLLGLALLLPVTSAFSRASILRPDVADEGRLLTVTCAYSSLILTPAILFLAALIVICAPQAVQADNFTWFTVSAALSVTAAAVLVNWSVRCFGATRLSCDSDRIVVNMGVFFRAEVHFSDVRTIEREFTIWPRLRIVTDGKVTAKILGFDTVRRSIVIGAPFLHGVHVSNLASSLMARTAAQAPVATEKAWS
jgi:hypothetical protein